MHTQYRWKHVFLLSNSRNSAQKMHCGSVANISCYKLHIIGLVNYLTRSIRPSGDLRCSYAVWLATHRALPLPCVSLRLGLALYFNNSSIACMMEQYNIYLYLIIHSHSLYPTYPTLNLNFAILLMVSWLNLNSTFYTIYTNPLTITYILPRFQKSQFSDDDNSVNSTILRQIAKLKAVYIFIP